ncbi:MAG: hypothetical protein B6D35_10970 [Candidatus Brocadia sp. UTAMX2]|jgi:5'-nucleotidase|nr:MAG: hypothetical protein B6D35_10970 [Candidatus Brocadia sp. UTAMX2]
MITRHMFHLAMLLICGFLGICCSATPVVKSEQNKAHREVKFKILQINDVYKIEGLEKGSTGGIARVRTLREQMEAEGQPVLVLLAGDFLFPSVMSKYLHAQPMVDMLNLLDGKPAGFDKRFIVAFGNHEFEHPDPGILLRRIMQSDFDWVSCNIRYCPDKGDPGVPFSHRFKNVHDALLLDIDGVCVGIFGLTNDSQPQDYIVYDYNVEKERNARIRESLDYLRDKGARVIIALTHQDLEEDRQLANDFPGEIDIIAGGHDHYYIQQQVGRTWITKADADARSAIRYDVRIFQNDSLIEPPRKVDLDSTVANDPDVGDAVNKWLGALSATMKAQTGRDPNEIIGMTRYRLEGVETAVRKDETALGNFLTDVVRARMRTDIAFINGGSIRINDNIPAGAPITVYDMEGIFYYDNKLVAFELTGAELLDILNHSVQRVDSGDGRFLQVSGIRFKYHADGTPGMPPYRVNKDDVEIMLQGESKYLPLELSRKYSAGSIDYLWKNGYRDGYTIFSQGNNGTSPKRIDAGQSISFRAVTEEAIAALPDRTVTTDREGRITAVRN